MSNTNLHRAKTEKNDEFYTQLSDIENEMRHYKKHFKGKHVFLNCDDPEKSNFWKFFSLNFEHLGLKALTSTHFDESSYKLEIRTDINGDGKIDYKDVVKTPLKGNGDFRSDEAIEILKECDIVVTNPPFSLFREYIAQLMEYDKDFIVVGPVMAMTYKEIFPLMKSNKMWIGHKRLGKFMLPSGEMKGVGTLWFTTLDFPKRHEDIILFAKYDNSKYIKYDNYNAIDCVFNRKVIVPFDYYGEVGVPITFMEKHNPKQFEVIRFRKGTDGKDLRLDGKDQALRIIIKRISTMEIGIAYYKEVEETHKDNKAVEDNVKLFLDDESGETTKELLEELGETTILGFVTNIDGKDVLADITVTLKGK